MDREPDHEAAPSGNGDDRAAQYREQRRTRDQALVLLIAGLALLLPPGANVLHIDARVFGVPTTLVYLFVVWAGLIVLTRRLSSRLREDDFGDGNLR